MHLDRVRRLRRELQRRGLDGAVCVPGPNLFYLTGLRVKLSERLTLAVIPADARENEGALQLALLLPELERPQAERALRLPARLHSYRDEEGPDRALAQLMSELKLPRNARLGVEGRRLRAFELWALQAQRPDIRWVDADEVFMRLRVRKDEPEIERIREALRLTEEALRRALDRGAVRAGHSEREVANALLRELFGVGAEGPSFEPIVASGPNGASPHAVPSERKLRAGDLVTLDLGAVWQGYFGDLTRNVAVGAIDPELERVHRVVEEANAAGREACRPGVPAQEVDRAARRVIEQAGYGDHFIHRTGHGLGLEVHEPPYLVEGNEQPLEPGMVFTVEPGVYLPGKGGARVEDVVLITPEGAETLTRFPRALLRL